jgi:hypothetical protein
MVLGRGSAERESGLLGPPDFARAFARASSRPVAETVQRLALFGAGNPFEWVVTVEGEHNDHRDEADR